jgi:hypothetical protein
MKPMTRFLLAMLTLGTVVLATEARGANQGMGKPLRLRSFPVEGGRTLDLVRKECSGKSCQLVVQLADRGKVLDEAKLAWSVAPGRPTREAPDVNSGVRGALSEATTPVGVSLGSDDDTVATFPRLVHFAAGRTGLLVTQRGGYDHVKRRHDLFVVGDSRLIHALGEEEPAGPAWSTTEVAGLAAGREAIVHVRTFEPGDDETPDTLEASRYAWDAKDDRLRAVSGKEAVPLYVLTAGRFPTIAAARAAKNEQAECLSPFVVIPLSSLEGPKGGGGKNFTLAAVSVQRAEAEAARAKIAGCAPTVKSSIVPGTGLPPAAKEERP